MVARQQRPVVDEEVRITAFEELDDSPLTEVVAKLGSGKGTKWEFIGNAHEALMQMRRDEESD